MKIFKVTAAAIIIFTLGAPLIATATKTTCHGFYAFRVKAVNLKTTTVTSQHLYIRSPIIDDIETYIKITMNKDVKNMANDRSFDGVSERTLRREFQNAIKQRQRRDEISFAVVDRASEKTIGFIFFDLEHRLHRSAEISYEFLPETWGRGLGTEALRALLPSIQMTFGVDHLLARTAVSNISSQRVLEKAGFVFLREEKPESYEDLYREENDKIFEYTTTMLLPPS
ncbi:MAG: GNAT family N-acetyltransferase [Bdellovibrionaceae bacterium]|nr:GNAT family N-acetyltransferase [Pseudobdellovibrionaceae bacterium]